jgi:hypothetical protein
VAGGAKFRPAVAVFGDRASVATAEAARIVGGRRPVGSSMAKCGGGVAPPTAASVRAVSLSLRGESMFTAG